MYWPVRFGFGISREPKQEKRPSRVPFEFKSKSEVKAMSFRERKLYFEGLLAELHAQQDEFGELKRQHLARIACRKFVGAAGSAYPVPSDEMSPSSRDLWNSDVH